MTIQQWLFSFKGRIGRRDFWIWIGLWFAGMLVLFSLAGKNLLDIQTAAFCLVCLLWPTPAVTDEPVSFTHLKKKKNNHAKSYLHNCYNILLYVSQ